MTLRDLMRMILESGIDIDTTISVAISEDDKGEWRYISLTNNVVNYDDGTCAIIGK
jgi:hypothetical protein